METQKVTKNGTGDKNVSNASSAPKNPNGCIIPIVTTPPKRGRIKKQAKSVKYEFLQVFKLLGGIQGMLAWAQSDNTNKSAFYSMYSKLLPKAVDMDLATDNVQRYELPEEERQELRATADRIIKLRLVKSGRNDGDNTTDSSQSNNINELES